VVIGDCSSCRMALVNDAKDWASEMGHCPRAASGHCTCSRSVHWGDACMNFVVQQAPAAWRRHNLRCGASFRGVWCVHAWSLIDAIVLGSADFCAVIHV
jgi:hypothetical protein